MADRPGVKPFLHAHDAHASEFIARKNRPFNRGGTAPTRKQRTVNVQAPETRQLQNTQGQDGPVCGNADNIGVKTRKRLIRFVAAQRREPEYRNLRRHGNFLYRRGNKLLAAPAHRIRPREATDHFVLRGKKSLQYLGGELGRAHEHYAHAIPSPRAWHRWPARCCNRAAPSHGPSVCTTRTR